MLLKAGKKWILKLIVDSLKFIVMNKKHLTEAEMQELLLRMKKNYTYDAATGRLTSSRYGRAIRGKRLGNRGYLVCYA